jgi:cytochrome c oxidase subunit 2
MRAGMFHRITSLGAVALTLTACSGDLSTLDPAGPYAGAIANLWWIMLIGSGLILGLVLVLLALVFFKPGFGRSLSPKGWMIAGGLFLPVPVLIALMTYGMAQGEYLIGAWQNEPVIARVEAHGAMWHWGFRYPDLGGDVTTDGTLHIPAGGVVEVRVTSADVVHSFWIPRLAGKIDAVPGHETTVRIRADVPGRYGGICAEYCGTGHAGMRFTVEAHPPETYRQRLTALSAGVSAP